MFAIRWSDVGRLKRPGEQRIEGLTLSIEAEHIAHWQADPDGVWQIEKARSSNNSAPRWTLTRWHPSASKGEGSR
jgi:hypothetical protein